MSIPIEGVLCEGELVQVGWPWPAEFDAITALRNRRRQCFFDATPLDPAANRKWLCDRSRRPQDALLAVRWKPFNSLIGTIGWSDWNVADGVATFGRLIIDPRRCRAHGPWPESYRGPTLDATIAVRDYAFQVMGLSRIVCDLLRENLLSQRVVRAIGFELADRPSADRPDGVLTFVLTRTRYDTLSQALCASPS